MAAPAAGNSAFAATCGLLPQFMREHHPQQHQQQHTGGAGVAGALRLPPLEETTTEEEEETTDDRRTMQLFPVRAGMPQAPQQSPAEVQAKAPLTIFYEGRVLVFRDFPVDKAKELMQMAGSTAAGSLPAPKKNAAPPVVVPAAERPVAAAANKAAPAAVPADLPIARKASLQRFLQKRKERVSAVEPYPKPKVAASASPEKEVAAAAGKPVMGAEPAASWLAL